MHTRYNFLTVFNFSSTSNFHTLVRVNANIASNFIKVVAMTDRQNFNWNFVNSEVPTTSFSNFSQNSIAHSSGDQRTTRSDESIINYYPVNPFTNLFLNPLAFVQPTFNNRPMGFVTPYHNNYNSPQFAYRNFSQSCNFQHNLSRQNFRRAASEEDVNRAYKNKQHPRGSKDVLSLRQWENIQTDVGSDSGEGLTFTLMSYNVLAQDLLDSHPFLYSEHKQNDLKWDVRWPNLLLEIKNINPEILCLQEVQGSHIEKFYSIFRSFGYEGIYKERTGNQTDGCAIYYKKNVLKLMECTTVEYRQPNVPTLNRDNVGIIMKFAPKEKPSEVFVVATTHLLFNRKREDVRLAQTQVLLSEIERLSFINNKDNAYCPVIITGDFNSTPDSDVYSFLIKSELRCYGELVPVRLGITDNCQHANLLDVRRKDKCITRAQETELIQLVHSDRYDEGKITRTNNTNLKLFNSGRISHNFTFKSVYNHGDQRNMEGTTFQDGWVTVDYIFYSGKKSQGKIKDDKLKLLARYKLPRRNQLQNIHIPNAVLGSDHLSLIAKFKLKF